MEEIDEIYVFEGYTYCGNIPENLQIALEMKGLPVFMKNSYAKEIECGAIGSFLRIVDVDYQCLGTDMFINLIEYPEQVRDGGDGALLFVRSFDAYEEYGKKVEPRCYSMRIVLSLDEKGHEFWECIDFETHYNLYCNDTILWNGKSK